MKDSESHVGPTAIDAAHVGPTAIDAAGAKHRASFRVFIGGAVGASAARVGVGASEL